MWNFMLNALSLGSELEVNWEETENGTDTCNVLYSKETLYSFYQQIKEGTWILAMLLRQS